MKGDNILIVDQNETQLARGLASLNSKEIDKIKGIQSKDIDKTKENINLLFTYYIIVFNSPLYKIH